MKAFALLAAAATSVLSLAACGDQTGGAGGTRDQIRAVGSSTVYPFATAAAELFVQSNPGMKSPIIESTGTAGADGEGCRRQPAGHSHLRLRPALDQWHARFARGTHP